MIAVVAALVGVLLLVYMIFGVIIWQVGVFNKPAVTTTKGWTEMQPLAASVSYKGKDFSASLVNAKGTSIVIKSVEAREILSGFNCTVSGPSANRTIAAGSVFEIKATCPNKKAGDPYEVNIIIEYNYVLGGFVVPAEEHGVIRGMAE